MVFAIDFFLSCDFLISRTSNFCLFSICLLTSLPVLLCLPLLLPGVSHNPGCCNFRSTHHYVGYNLQIQKATHWSLMRHYISHSRFITYYSMERDYNYSWGYDKDEELDKLISAPRSWLQNNTRKIVKLYATRRIFLWILIAHSFEVSSYFIL